MIAEHVDALDAAIQTRPRPEDVAELVQQILRPTLAPEEDVILERAAQYSYKRRADRYTRMAQDFFRPSTEVHRQLQISGLLFGVTPPTCTEALDPAPILAYVQTLGQQIGKLVGRNDFRTDRFVTKQERRAHGLWKNARWYNKRWRLLKTIELKLASHVAQQQLYTFTRIGKSALATQITREEVGADANTGCLVAYLSARMSLRSTFTNTSQVRAYDEIAEMLLQRCERSVTTRWGVVAHVMPDARVVSRLTEAEKGTLLGRWWGLLSGIATALESCWKRSSFDFTTMVVSRGDDSSTWNQLASAWNMARTHWMSLLHALRMEGLLDALCPGKVMRLMAADVAYWHRLSGGQIHPDTAVWAVLPRPWAVMRGEAVCTARMVLAVCRAHRVSPDSWLGEYATRQPARFMPTPELVHGVVVSSPALASLLRKAGVFSGKAVKATGLDFQVVRDDNGFALEVHDTSDDDTRSLR